MSINSEWLSVSIGLPGEIQNTITQTGNILGSVSTILETTATVLETLKSFIIDVSSTLSTTINALLILVNSLIEDFDHSGLYMYVDMPKNTDQGYGYNLKGGLDGWRDRMAYALLSPNVSNRPNFSNTSSVVSFHLVVTSGTIVDLISRWGFLAALFKQKAAPNLNPPKNFQIRAINADFYNSYYKNGYIDITKIATVEETILDGSISLRETFIAGGGAVDPTNMDLVLRYDWMTGQEYIVEKNSGAVLTTGGTADAALLTWKLDQHLIPTTFRIERSGVQGGSIETYDAKDIAGNVVSTGEISRDSEGEPIRTATTIDTVTVNYGYGQTMSGDAHEQYVYLDTTVEVGKSYWYRVVPVYGSAASTIYPTIDQTTSDTAKKIYKLIQTISKAVSGDGIPTEFKGIYIPDVTEDNTIKDMVLRYSMRSNGDWWTSAKDLSGDGWSKIAIGNIFDPTITAIKEVQNFTLAYQSAVEGMADQISSFITLIETKINTLNTFIEMLDSIISLLEIFETLSFGCLYTVTDQGTQGVIQAINTSSDTMPIVGTDDYVASVTLLGSTVGAGTAINAIRLIFGLI